MRGRHRCASPGGQQGAPDHRRAGGHATRGPARRALHTTAAGRAHTAQAEGVATAGWAVALRCAARPGRRPRRQRHLWRRSVAGETTFFSLYSLISHPMKTGERGAGPPWHSGEARSFAGGAYPLLHLRTADDATRGRGPRREPFGPLFRTPPPWKRCYGADEAPRRGAFGGCIWPSRGMKGVRGARTGGAR